MGKPEKAPRTLPQGGVGQDFGDGDAVLDQEPRIEETGVNADAGRGAVVVGGLGDRAKSYRGGTWMQAISGIWDSAAMAGRAAASSWEGQVTWTMAQPSAVSSAIYRSVAATFVVTVVMITCTGTGWSLPAPTVPTRNCRIRRYKL